ncbi:MAG: glutathione S-transferase [Alphaproteobacteria bacterium PA4]|nr:MAG: glutathione S-transferase [Alphaproteobacteria bacterium PA4]
MSVRGMGRSASPLLFSFRRCPYAIRARLALAVSGIDVAVHEVRLSAKPAALLAASPKATVPVLVLADGRVIDESLDIMRWALALHDPEHWLAHADAAVIATNDTAFKQHLDAWKYRGSGEDRDAGLAILAALDVRLAAQPQLGGARPGLTDMAILPFVRQFAAVDSAWFAGQPLPRLQHWLAAHLATPLFQRVMAKSQAGGDTSTSSLPKLPPL